MPRCWVRTEIGLHGSCSRAITSVSLRAANVLLLSLVHCMTAAKGRMPLQVEVACVPPRSRFEKPRASLTDKVDIIHVHGALG